MLTVDQRNQMIDSRIQEYEAKIFDMEMNIVALDAIGDATGVLTSNARIEALRKAIEAVNGMRE